MNDEFLNQSLYEQIETKEKQLLISNNIIVILLLALIISIMFNFM